VEEKDFTEKPTKVFYQKGQYILYGNSITRDSIIFCQFFSEEARIKLLEVLNKEKDVQKSNILQSR
jgi:hypothetical protein